MPKFLNLSLKIHPEDHRTFGPCDCCGEMTSRVWGYVESHNEAIAAYFVEWTPGHEGTEAAFDLIIGKWGDSAQPSDRFAASVDFRKLNTGPAFMVVDAESRKVASSPLVSRACKRNEIIGTDLAADVFAICDLIFLEDPRLSVLRG